jgi:plasmid stabilization system protein ParE
MRNVVWSEEARENLKAVQAYTSEFNLNAGRRLAVKLVDLAESLVTMPDRGRMVRSGVRELTSIRPYIIRYTALPGEIRIVSVRHSAMRPLR